LKSFVIHPIAFAGAHGCALGEAWITVKHFLGIKKEASRLRQKALNGRPHFAENSSKFAVFIPIFHLPKAEF
jgi:hypothetical protein